VKEFSITFSANSDRQNKTVQMEAVLKGLQSGVSLSISCFVFDFDALYSMKRDA